jgi:flagellar basal-body rod modification protein FlgD
MATSSILHHSQLGAMSATSASTLPGGMATAQANGSGSSSSSSGDSSLISANDFLTLLVTEMQNQDPTADTDPNAYIDQLVQVNSLEQLIQMNQNLSTALGITPSTSNSTSGSTAAASPLSGTPTTPAAPGASAASVLSATSSKTATTHQSAVARKGQSSNNLVSGLSTFAGNSGSASPISGVMSKARSVLSGNLGAAKSSPAAMRVAHSLDGKKKSP